MPEEEKKYPIVKEWDSYNPTYSIGSTVIYRGIPHKVIDSGEQGARLAAIRDLVIVDLVDFIQEKENRN